MSNQHTEKIIKKASLKKTRVINKQSGENIIIVGQVCRLSYREAQYYDEKYVVSKQELGKRIIIGMPSEAPLITEEGWKDSVYSK